MKYRCDLIFTRVVTVDVEAMGIEEAEDMAGEVLALSDISVRTPSFATDVSQSDVSGSTYVEYVREAE